MTVTTESGGRQNAFPNETRPYIDESASYEGYPVVTVIELLSYVTILYSKC